MKLMLIEISNNLSHIFYIKNQTPRILNKKEFSICFLCRELTVENIYFCCFLLLPLKVTLSTETFRLIQLLLIGTWIIGC